MGQDDGAEEALCGWDIWHQSLEYIVLQLAKE